MQKRSFLYKLPFFSSEVYSYNKKTEEKEFINVPSFTKEFINYNPKADFKIEKNRLILPKNYDIEFPFVLYESNGRKIWFYLKIISASISLTYLFKYFQFKLTKVKKYNPQFTTKYLVIHLLTVSIALFFLKQHMRIIKKITINNLNGSADEKNLTIDFFSGITMRENISSLWFDKPLLMRTNEHKFSILNIKEQRHYLTFHNSKVYDKALFMSILRGCEFTSNK